MQITHFEAVIVRLQEIAAEENENADKNGSTELGDCDIAYEGVPDASDVNVMPFFTVTASYKSLNDNNRTTAL